MTTANYNNNRTLVGARAKSLRDLIRYCERTPAEQRPEHLRDADIWTQSVPLKQPEEQMYQNFMMGSWNIDSMEEK